jgi:hypothetical protein
MKFDNGGVRPGGARAWQGRRPAGFSVPIEEPIGDDGTRIPTERPRPRGVAKEKATISTGPVDAAGKSVTN